MDFVTGKGSPHRKIVVYGEPGVGKTRFACCDDSGSPRPRVVAFEGEQGAGYFGVQRVLPKADYLSNRGLIRELCTSDGPWDTVVVDGADSLFEQASREFCAKKRQKDGSPYLSPADAGWNDGWHAMAARWRELLFDLDAARPRGRTVILVCHARSMTEKNPTVGDFRKFTGNIHDLSWGPTFQWADAVMFATYDRAVKDKIVSVGDRELRTKTGPGFDAKHRPELPSPLPLSWESYMAAVASTERTAEEVQKSIDQLLDMVPAENADNARKKLAARVGDVGFMMLIESKLKQKADSVKENAS